MEYSFESRTEPLEVEDEKENLVPLAGRGDVRCVCLWTGQRGLLLCEREKDSSSNLLGPHRCHRNRSRDRKAGQTLRRGLRSRSDARTLWGHVYSQTPPAHRSQRRSEVCP